MAHTKQPFMFQAGTGTLRAKLAPHHTMYFGAMALPDIGQCFIDGVVENKDKTLELDIKRKDTRAIVAHLSLPRTIKSVGDVAETSIKVGEKTWKVVATLRVGEDASDKSIKHYLALRLPEVKIQPGSANGFGPRADS